MLNKDSLMYIGYISRPHSFKGEIQLQFNKEVVSLKRNDFLFIRIDGHFIPYQIEGIKGKPEEPVLRLAFINSYEKAQEISGSEVYVEGTEEEDAPMPSLEEFVVVDKKLGTVGKVEAVLEMPEQVLLQVTYNHKVCYIPLVDVFINHISEENKEIWMNLPEGLLDL
jgi:16S rRNA processing protein RimM